MWFLATMVTSFILHVRCKYKTVSVVLLRTGSDNWAIWDQVPRSFIGSNRLPNWTMLLRLLFNTVCGLFEKCLRKPLQYFCFSCIIARSPPQVTKGKTRFGIRQVWDQLVPADAQSQAVCTTPNNLTCIQSPTVSLLSGYWPFRSLNIENIDIQRLESS